VALAVALVVALAVALVVVLLGLAVALGTWSVVANVAQVVVPILRWMSMVRTAWPVVVVPVLACHSSCSTLQSISWSSQNPPGRHSFHRSQWTRTNSLALVLVVMVAAAVMVESASVVMVASALLELLLVTS
jgi:hypothetical protein